MYCAYCGDEIIGQAVKRRRENFCSIECADRAEEADLADSYDDADLVSDYDDDDS